MMSFAEAIRQRDEARAEVAKLKPAIAELRTLLSVVCDVSTREREQHQACLQEREGEHRQALDPNLPT